MRSAPAPADDLSSKLLAAEVDGRKLDDFDFLLFFLLLVDAGGDTTRNLLRPACSRCSIIPTSSRHCVRELETALPGAREELLRWISPVIYMRRTAKRDTEIAGQRIRAGDKVVLYFGAANCDEREFPQPDPLDLSPQSESTHRLRRRRARLSRPAHRAHRDRRDAARSLARMHDIETDAAAGMARVEFHFGSERMPVRFRAASRSR